MQGRPGVGTISCNRRPRRVRVWVDRRCRRAGVAAEESLAGEGGFDHIVGAILDGADDGEELVGQAEAVCATTSFGGGCLELAAGGLPVLCGGDEGEPDGGIGALGVVFLDGLEESAGGGVVTVGDG